VAWGVPKIGALATPVASGDLTLAEPAGIASGDLMLACFAIRSNVGFTLPGDWNLVDQELTGDTDATNGIASAQMFWTVRGGSAPTLTFSRTGGNLGMGRIIAYTGGHASTPFDVSDSATADVTSTVTSGAGLTTAEAGELLVAITSAGDNFLCSNFVASTDPNLASGVIDTTTAPGNGTGGASRWIKRADDTSGTGADGGLSVHDAVKASAGGTSTLTASFGTGARSAFVVGAFKLAAAGGGGDPISPYYSSYYSRMIQEGSQF
jgi:hypothetical protein